jgi:hypothetical protein
MKKTLFLLLCGALSLFGCHRPDRATDIDPAESHMFLSGCVKPPIGSLGYLIGTYLTIEGHRYEPTDGLKRPGRILLVDTVQGNRLDVPVKLIIKNVDTDSMNTQTRWILNGYESGAWVGSPEGLPPGTPVEQHQFHFHRYFVVTSVESPAQLKIKR